MTDLICDGPVTKQIVQQILCEYFKAPEAVLARCQGIVISAGKGFTSDVMRVDLEWSNHKSAANLPTRVIVKAPRSSCMQDIAEKLCMGQEFENSPTACSDAVQMIHESECNAYKVLRMDKTTPLPLPLIYGFRVSDPGVIVMEDLAPRADNVQDIADGLTLGQWTNIADCLADLHAWSLTTSVPWRQHIKGFETMPTIFKSWIDMTAGLLKVTKQKYPTYFGQVNESLYEREINFDHLMSKHEIYRQILPDVMQHGDTWTNNILFEKDARGQLTDKVAAFIDWQISLTGCGLNDLARVTFMCVGHELRRKNELHVVRRYYNRLVSKSGQAISPSVTFEKMWKIYRHIFAMNGLMGVLMADFMLRFMVKAGEDESDPRREKVLSQMKAAYEDAEEFLIQPDCNEL